jgi:hypothetical protein
MVAGAVSDKPVFLKLELEGDLVIKFADPCNQKAKMNFLDKICISIGIFCENLCFCCMCGMETIRSRFLVYVL